MVEYPLGGGNPPLGFLSQLKTTVANKATREEGSGDGVAIVEPPQCNLPSGEHHCYFSVFVLSTYHLLPLPYYNSCDRRGNSAVLRSVSLIRLTSAAPWIPS